MHGKPSVDELRCRIQNDIAHFGGKLPESYALVWDGYLAALIEWGLLSPNEHKLLSDLLPEIDNNPVISILLGRPDTQ
jgi:hypothetical protein